MHMFLPPFQSYAGYLSKREGKTVSEKFLNELGPTGKKAFFFIITYFFNKVKFVRLSPDTRSGPQDVYMLLLENIKKFLYNISTR